MEPLEIAIKMEFEGKEFYQEASRKTSDKLGKDLFSQLAEDEDLHAARAREIHKSLKLGDRPSEREFSFDQGKKLKSIFAKAKKELAPKRRVASSKLKAIQLALDMEEKSRKFYEEQSSSAKTDFERRFFTALKQEEQGHYLSLVDYREYLIDPISYFTKSERISLDGA
jgi:rubrerythrin